MGSLGFKNNPAHHIVNVKYRRGGVLDTLRGIQSQCPGCEQLG